MKLDRRIIAIGLASLLASTSAVFADDAKPADAAAPAPAADAATPAPAAPAATPAPAAQPAPAAPTAAPVQVPAAVQAWAKFCDNDPKDGHKVCLVQKAVFEGTSKVANLTFRIDSKKGVPTLLLAALPLDIVLTSGLTWQIDKQKPITTPFWRCTPQFCESQQLINAAVIKRLQAAKSLTLTVKNLSGKKFAVDVPLSGFGAAYNKADAPTYAEYVKSIQTAVAASAAANAATPAAAAAPAAPAK